MGRLKGVFLIVMAAALWGFIGPFARLAFSEGIAPLEVAFWRAVLAWLLFGGQAIARRQYNIRKKDIPNFLLFGFFGVTLFYSAYQFAVQLGGAAVASVLLYTAPAWVVIISRILFKELLSPVKLTSLVATICGIVMISWAGGSGSAITSWGIFFGLLSGFCYSLYYIFGKYFSDHYSAANLFLYILPVGIVGLLPFVSFTHKSPTAWAALIFLAAFSTFGAYHLYYAGLKYLEAGRASIIATLEPVIAAVVAYVWWHESFHPSGYIGSVLIIAAVLLMIVFRSDTQQEDSVDPPAHEAKSA